MESICPDRMIGVQSLDQDFGVPTRIDAEAEPETLQNRTGSTEFEKCQPEIE